jgi:predicted TIM-barrel fold metal-dependent hydrolase
MIVDCHVSIWNDEDVRPHFHTQLGRIRERLIESKAHADTLDRVMASVDRAVIFALSYGDTVGIESDDGATAAACKKYPDRFVGFAYVYPRRPDYMERLRIAIEEYGLKGVKYGPISS